ncbi:MAG: hypothetical protein HN413_16065 [Chloroflexi bacterium]|jgi:Tfp pilus assembly protein PilP|nr:hypothetical protein [Chloroflexota bacterium]
MKTNKTLCELKEEGVIKKEFKAYKTLVRNGEFVCQNCGRVARRKKNLCEAKRLFPKKK